MTDTLTTIMHLINSPPGQLAAGGALAGIVWKFFERVESVLTDQTKLEIAVWLLGVKVGQKVGPWPDTFAKVFDRVFGESHLSWKCFWRSVTASVGITLIVFIIAKVNPVYPFYLGDAPFIFTAILAINVLPDYVSLLETRWLLSYMQRSRDGFVWLGLVLLDFVLTTIIGLLAVNYFGDIAFNQGVPKIHSWVSKPFFMVKMFFSLRMWYYFYPAFFTSIWLWLYAGSGFLLKAARRFDIGFDWFNRRFDIEKKPLQSIGLVAGALVAVVYWATVIVRRVVG
jgi:hypothetical protein